MSSRSQEFRVGVVALSLATVGGILATIGTGVSLPLGLGPSPYQIQIRTDRAPGVGPNTPIRKDGVVIGRVVSTQFLSEGGVLVTASIQPGSPIFQSDSCRIRPSSLFGDAVINFAYDGDGGPVEKVTANSLVTAAALPDPVEAITSLQVDVGPTIESIGRAAASIEELTTRVNSALGDDFGGDRMVSLVDEASTALTDFKQTMNVMSDTLNKLDSLVSDPALKESLDTVPTLLADARTTVNRATNTLESFSGVVTSAETNLKNLEGFTEPLGERGDELSQLLTESIENLNKTLTDASTFVTAVTDSRGSLNRLLNDPQLYENVANVVYNADVVLRQLNERLKEIRPILHDARVFSDKIAREPGRLIGGAVNRGPGLK